MFTHLRPTIAPFATLANVLTVSVFALTLVATSARAAPAFSEFVDPHPSAGNGFGTHVVALSTGNVVITSPKADVGGTNTGAVYLFNGATGVLISTLTGSTNEDQAGLNGVTALANGNYVVSSVLWDNGAATDAGAATWGSGTTGISGSVSASNSLIGSTANDKVGENGILALTNGHYVVSCSSWDNGTLINVGAATWGNGTTGITGTITTDNSLVGSTNGDNVGLRITALTNGHYVVSSFPWDNGTVANVGAVTWGNGTTGITGPVTTDNSLVGSQTGDSVGSNGVAALNNGHYVVRTSSWSNGTVISAGAVTWGNGTTGITGPVTTENSLVGSSASDSIGNFGIRELANGNYLVLSGFWNNGPASRAGAVTWVNGTTGITGVVSADNSLVGTTANDSVGGGGVTALTNGHYVVPTPAWDNGTVANVGAVTWGNGTTGITGPVNTTNSLVGSAANDSVGEAGVTALTNGNYVVGTPDWNNAAKVDAGAATWANGTTGITGPVSVANSLVGSDSDDYVGERVIALTNGNYVVVADEWDNGPLDDVGAVTWGNGTTGITGPVSPTNSLVGSMEGDEVGATGVTALTNGNYVVHSPNWSNGVATDVGAATWGNGATGITGPVSTANSLVGSSSNDRVGRFAVALPNGHCAVGSISWRNGALALAGAATWQNGTATTSGFVSAANSLVGLAANSGFNRIVLDNVNKHFIAPFVSEGKVRVGSQLAPYAELAFRGNSVSIAHADTTPDAADHTDFGSTGGGSVARTFTVLNTGGADLTLSTGSITLTGSHAADFSISGITLPATVAAEGSTTFTVTFAPSASGTRSATVNIASNDPIRATYTFAVQGTGLNGAPTDIQLSATSLPENNAPNATVATLTTTDADTEDSHTYSLVEGTGDDDNDSFTIQDDLLNITPSADFETKSSYSIRIQTDDGEGGTYDKAFVITITDILEKPEFTVAGPLVLNKRTGLFEHFVTITNPTTTTMDGFRLACVNLPTTLRLYNATHAPLPIIEDLTDLAPGASRQVLVQYYSRLRKLNGFLPQYAVELLTAGTEPAPTSVKGTWHGLISPSDTRKISANPHLGSRVDLEITAKGYVTGSITEGGTRKAIKGQLGLNPAKLSRPSLSVLVPGTAIRFTLEIVGNTDTFIGTLGQTPRQSATPDGIAYGWRRVWTRARPATDYKGRHNFVIENTISQTPEGFGFGTISVVDSNIGNFSHFGRLPDGSTTIGSSFVGPSGQVRVYQALYGSKGSFTGHLSILASPGQPQKNVIGGQLHWFKPADPNPRATNYPAGFGPLEVTCEGAYYSPPAAGTPVLGLPVTTPGTANSEIVFSLGGLASNISQPLHTAPPARLTVILPNPNQVQHLILNPITGLFGGGFSLSGSPPRLGRFQGILTTTSATGEHGFGFFLLPQSPVPPQTMSTAPVLSGQVEFCGIGTQP